MNFHPVRNPSCDAHLWFSDRVFNDVCLKWAAWERKKKTSRLSHWGRIFCSLQKERKKKQNSRSCYIKTFIWSLTPFTVFDFGVCVPAMWRASEQKPMAKCFYSCVVIGVLVFWMFGSYINHILTSFFFPNKHPDDDKHLNIPCTWIDKHSHKDMDGLLNFSLPEPSLWSGFLLRHVTWSCLC